MADRINAVSRSVAEGPTAALVTPTSREDSAFPAVAASAPHEDIPSTDPVAQLVDLGTFMVCQPLVSHYAIPTGISRLVIDADRDIIRGRLESALDLTLAAEIEQPGCLGLYVRQAELLLATGRHDSAANIVSAIAAAHQVLQGPSVDVELERILTHADPSETNVLHLARTLLGANRTDLIDRYLPIAVDAASLQDDPELAMELAQRWLEIRPNNLDAAFSVTREGLRLGKIPDGNIVLENVPNEDRDPRALIVRLVIDCVADGTDQWVYSAKLLKGIETKSFDVARIESLLREMIAVQSSNEALLVHLGMLEADAGNPDAGHQLLNSIRPSNPFSYYVSTVTCARAALASGDVASASDALVRAMELYEKPEIAEFSATCPVLHAPHDMFSVGRSIAGVLQQNGEAAEGAVLLKRLSKLSPDRGDLSRAYADALAKSGKREIAVAQLEAMLRQHESSGETEAMILTIQSILQIAPGNLRLRARLINEFMKRGRLQEAVHERWTLAQILERAGRNDEAIDQLSRASDVASTLGDWKKLERILRMMIRIRPDDLDVRHSAATKFLEYGQIQLAIEQLWAAAQISNRSNDPDETIAALHQIIALGPHHVDAYHKLGEVLASVGEYAQAERVYRRLASMMPDDPAIQAKQSALAAMATSAE